MKFYVCLFPAASVFLPGALPEVGHQFPDECEEGVVVGILGNLQVPIDEGAEVIGEELSEDVASEKLPQVQAILQEKTDKLGPVLYESHEHDLPKVGGLRRKSRESIHALDPGKEAQGLSQTHISSHKVVGSSTSPEIPS